MRKRNLIWTHSKYPSRKYYGGYSKDSRSGERVFALVTNLKNGRVHKVDFESHEAAKQMGWSRRKAR